MDIELFKNISTILIIGATIFNLYVVYKNYKIVQKNYKIVQKIEMAKTPVMDIKLDNLPPYENENEKTILRLKNVGTKQTNPEFSTIVSCSWMPSLSLKFNLPSSGYYLAPNEEITWKFRLDENFLPTSTVHVKVNDKGSVWVLTEQL